MVELNVKTMNDDKSRRRVNLLWDTFEEGVSCYTFPRRAACLLLLAVMDVALSAHCHADDKGLWLVAAEEGPGTPSGAGLTPATAATAETVATAIPVEPRRDAVVWGLTMLIGGATPIGGTEVTSATLKISGDDGLITIDGLPSLSPPGYMLGKPSPVPMS